MLMGARLGFWGGKRLPYDAEVEYLESSGTQYIDTGVTGGSGTKVEITAASANTGTNMALFGARNASSVLAFVIWQRVGNSSLAAFDYSSTTAERKFANGRWDTAGINTVTKDGAANTLNGVDGENNNAKTFSCDCPFYLFAIDSANTASMLFTGKIYSCKIWDANGNLVADYIPVRVGNVGKLFDRVTQSFPEHFGEFGYGADVVPVEYIESHGTEWINTGIFASACDEVELSFAVRTIGFRNYIFGCSSNRFGYTEVTIANKFKTETASTYNISPLTLYKVTFKKSDFSVLINGTTLDITCGTSSTSLFSRDDNFAISCTAPDGRYTGKMLIYGVELSSDSQTLRGFKPVRVGNEGAVMDTLTRRIYRNAGTGSFSYGNDLPYPIGG